MANEVSMSVALSASKGGAVINPGTLTKQLTMAGDDMFQRTYSITTGYTLISMADITGVPSAVLVKNLDATNNIIISGESGFTAVLQLTLLPGVANLFSPTSATLYAKTSASNCKLLIAATEA